jgi:hypothetical protein
MAYGKDHIGPPGVRCAYPTHYPFSVPHPRLVARDGVRCTLTGTFDKISVEYNRKLDQQHVILGLRRPEFEISNLVVTRII